MAAIIEMDGVSFSYDADARRALSDVSLRVEEGDFLGIIGPSGAGKSTLAACLSGAIPHHFTGELYGATRVAGHDTCEITLTDISRTVGSVAQDIDAQMVASVVEDELLFGLENFGVPHDQIEGRIARTLETAGISELRHREIATLSGGQKQKVAIAAILALEPRVLVLDEPTAALDPVSSQVVFDTLADINRRLGITVIVIEQKVALLSSHCNRIVVMDRGGIALEGSPHEVFRRAELLRKLGVDSPRTARISNSLAAAGLCAADDPCLNVEEAHDLIAQIIRRADATGPGAAGADAAHVATDARTAGQASATPHAATPSPHAPRRPHAEGAAPVLTFEHVGFTYPGGGASVEDLSLEVYPGELVGVVGQNGAGKTTLTKLLNGLLRPSRGRVRVAGLDTGENPVSAIAAHVSTLFQNPDRQICKNTVIEEVAFGLELQGVDSREAQRRAEAVIDRFGLPRDEAPFSLSRGQRQMVALAGVVVMDPDVVVLDEPTSGLDYRECMTVMETVRDMADKGCAVVMVCHDMEVVSDFAERIVVMAGGRILGRGPASELFADSELMARASVTPPQVIDLAGRLARDVSPTFAHISEVSDIVRRVKELADHA